MKYIYFRKANITPIKTLEMLVWCPKDNNKVKTSLRVIE